MGDTVTDSAAESVKRLEVEVKRISTAGGGSSKTAGENNLASPDTSYVGSMVGIEGSFPNGMRHRVIDPPVGRKVGYHEDGDEKEEGDVDWMLGDASSLSGAGTRGSKNWVLKVMVPILLIVGIICMHTWWTDIKKGASHVTDAIGDVVDGDRRLLENQEGVTRDNEAFSRMGLAATGAEERQAGIVDKAVYAIDLKEGSADAGDQA